MPRECAVGAAFVFAFFACSIGDRLDVEACEEAL